MDFNHYLHDIFNPKVIAVFGASQKEGSYGAAVWSGIQSSDPQVRLIPINPKYKKLGSVKCYASLEAYDGPVDLALVCSPPASYTKIIDACIAQKVPAILFFGGYPKTDLVPAILKKFDEAAQNGVRIIGPQSLGFLSVRSGINASFLPQLPKAGSIGLVSQSPGLTISIIDAVSSNSEGFSYVVDPGLERDLTVSDFVDFLAHDRKTECIALYLESFQNPRKLLSAIRMASVSKPVVLLKGGQTRGAADIVINNSGAREDEDGVMRRALIRAGALLVSSLRDLVDAVQIFSSLKSTSLLPAKEPGGISGRRGLFGVVNSKGLDSLLADHAFSCRLNLGEADSTVAQALSEQFRITYPYANPINIGLNAGVKDIVALINYLLARPECTGIILGLVSSPLLDPKKLAEALIPITKKTDRLVVTAWVGSTRKAADAVELLRSKGCAAFHEMRGACAAIEHFERFLAGRKLVQSETSAPLTAKPESFEGARRIIRRAKEEGRNLLYEEESKKLLASIGFKTTAGISANSLGEVLEAAHALGFPLAMKVSMRGVLSKSNIGGVLLGLRNERELENAWFALSEQVSSLMPEAKDNFGVFLQRTLDLENKRELRLGLKITKSFGPIVYLGIGGLYGELCTAPIFNFAPMSRQDAVRMLEELPFRELLAAYKGLPECDKASIVTSLLLLSQLASEIPAVRSLEIDPLLCCKNQAIVLDAHCVIGDGALYPDREASHLIFPYRSAIEKNISGRFGNLTLKTASPQDKKSFEHYVENLSEPSRLLRFHSGATSCEKLALNATCYDPDQTYSLIAVRRPSESPQKENEIVAEAQFSVMPSDKTGEFGISVRDDLHKKGLASVLMCELENEARLRGLESLTGYVLKSNDAMAEMMKKRGYVFATDPDDPRIGLYTLDLSKEAQKAPDEKSRRA